MTEKSPEAFRTISEVAEELDLPQHVLRFWETRFSQIKPMKRGGGRRYYRPEDVNLLKGIRFLLYGEGYTIKGVQRILKEQGVRHVSAVWEELDPDSAPQPAQAQPTVDAPPPQPRVSVAPQAGQGAPAGAPMQTRVITPKPVPPEPEFREPEPLQVAPAPPVVPAVPGHAQPGGDPQTVSSPQPSQPPASPPPAAQPPAAQPPAAQPPVAHTPVAPPAAPVEAPAYAPQAPVSKGGLSEDGSRQLKAALFELIECKQILEATLAAGPGRSAGA